MLKYRRAPLSRLLLFVLVTAVSAGVGAQAADTRILSIPGGGHALGFDDLGYSGVLNRILVPAAQTGALVLINPSNNALRVLAHVVPPGKGPDRDDAGTTSADYGAGLLFASDHADQAIVAISPKTGKVLARAKLMSGPDYVRYVAPLHEVWVTEPRAKEIQRFSVATGSTPGLRDAGSINIPGGPESLVIDTARGVAYTNQWKDHTLTITLKQPHVVSRWPNTCTGSRGLALAPAQHLLFVGCKEGKIVGLNLDQGGKVITSVKVGAGVDIIAWNPHLKHLYAPGAASATLSVLKLESNNHLKKIAVVAAAEHSHCVATDGHQTAYVCDPEAGNLIVYHDPG